MPIGTGWPTPPETVAESETLVPGTTLPPVGVEVVTVDEGCFSVVKHSVVMFVWLEAL